MASSKLPTNEEKLAELKETCEHFHQANQVALELLGTLIPQVDKKDQYEVYHQLGVVEDILSGASARYTT